MTFQRRQTYKDSKRISSSQGLEAKRDDQGNTGDFRAVKLFCTVHDTTYVSKLTELSSTMIPNVKNLVYLSTLVLFFKV